MHLQHLTSKINELSRKRRRVDEGTHRFFRTKVLDMEDDSISFDEGWSVTKNAKIPLTTEQHVSKTNRDSATMEGNQPDDNQKGSIHPKGLKSSRVHEILSTYLPPKDLISKEFFEASNTVATGSYLPMDDPHVLTSSNLKDTVSKVQQLRRVYLYGLQQVSELQDLQKAPDAILPGNFVKVDI